VPQAAVAGEVQHGAARQRLAPHSSTRGTVNDKHTELR
jgi:hypothetical protein